MAKPVLNSIQPTFIMAADPSVTIPDAPAVDRGVEHTHGA